MAIKIIIKGTPVEIPESGSSPNWAPGIIDAIQELADAIAGLSATYDVSPQVQSISLYPTTSINIPINNLIFPNQEVRAATIFYSVSRRTLDLENEEGDVISEGSELTEAGTLQILYSAENKWQIQREYIGNGGIIFKIDADSGQISFNTSAISGDPSSHEGILSYRAISILNT